MCASPENKQPAVQWLGEIVRAPTDANRIRINTDGSDFPDEKDFFSDRDAASACASSPSRSSSKFISPVQRPLPGAFASQGRTVIFFDWDDTLCPTSWIRSKLKTTLADMEVWGQGGREESADWYTSVPRWFHHPLPDEPKILEQIQELQLAVIGLINVSQAYGVVCIVTNAVPGWVLKTIQKWLPQLMPYINGHGARPRIKILYGQSHFIRRQALEDLGWVDDRGEYMWWKKAAMDLATDDVQELYRLEASPRRYRTTSQVDSCPSFSWTDCADAKRLTNIVSVGDNEAEMQAAKIVGSQRGDWRDMECKPGNSFFCGAESPGVFSPGVASPGVAGVFSPSVALTSPGVASVFSGAFDEPRGRGPEQRRSCRTGTSVPAGGCSRRPWVKLVKLSGAPKVDSMIAHLHAMAEMMPNIVAARADMRLELGHDGPEADGPDADDMATPRMDFGSPKLAPRPVQHSQLVHDIYKELENKDLALGRALRVQTV